jgi:hypothetical protein
MNSKRFYLFKDSLSLLDKMTNEQAGIFIKSIYQYQITGKLPILDFGLDMAITPFINQFIRDDEAYKKVCERNKHNGLHGGRPTTQDNPDNPVGYLLTQDNPDNPVGYLLTQDNPDKPYKDKDTDTDTNKIRKDNIKSVKKDKLLISETAKAISEVFDFWKLTMNSPDSKLDKKRSKLIELRLSEFTIEVLKEAIIGCSNSTFHMGDNDRNTKYNSIEFICRDVSNVEKFINKPNSTYQFDPNKPPPETSPLYFIWETEMLERNGMFVSSENHGGVSCN